MSRFLFAWVEEGDPFIAREDEDIFAVEVAHSEGEFPSLTVDILNPRVGLLTAARSQWCWLGWEPDGGAPAPLFHGRIVGVPQELHGEVIRIAFIAKPSDYTQQRQALSDVMRVAPYWDPIWYNEESRADPDTTLEARSQLWHIDRITHNVSASDINIGEDGTLIFGPGDFFYDGVDMSFGQTPVSRVDVTLTANWQQIHSGSVDITPQIVQAFRDAGSKQNPTSFTGDGFLADFPKINANIGGGWRVSEESYIDRVDGVWAPTQAIIIKYNKPKEVVATDVSGEPLPVGAGAIGAFNFTGAAAMVAGAEDPPDPVYVAKFPLWMFDLKFVAKYDANRKRTDIFTFSLEADVQPLVADPAGGNVLPLTLSSANLSEEIEGEAPIGDLRRRSYFATERGARSLENAIATARSRLLMRARAVEIKFETRWETALGLSCRHNALIEDPRLPGGQAAGKVIAYTLTSDGGSGRLSASVTIGCVVGRGRELAARPGSPAYVEDDYVAPDYQVRLEFDVMPLPGEVTYTQDYLETPPADDGLDFFDLRPEAVLRVPVAVYGGETEQRAALASVPSMEDPTDSMREIYTEVALDFWPVNGTPYETQYTTTMSKLMVPKTIDMEVE